MCADPEVHKQLTVVFIVLVNTPNTQHTQHVISLACRYTHSIVLLSNNRGLTRSLKFISKARVFKGDCSVIRRSLMSALAVSPLSQTAQEHSQCFYFTICAGVKPYVQCSLNLI